MFCRLPTCTGVQLLLPRPWRSARLPARLSRKVLEERAAAAEESLALQETRSVASEGAGVAGLRPPSREALQVPLKQGCFEMAHSGPRKYGLCCSPVLFAGKLQQGVATAWM